MAEQVALSSDVESRLSDDSDGRNQKFQLPSGKKRVVVFAVVVALMCGAAVFAPASSAPNSNLKGDIVKMYESCASSLQPRCAHLTGDCCPTAEGVFLDCCESSTPPQGAAKSTPVANPASVAVGVSSEACPLPAEHFDLPARRCPTRDSFSCVAENHAYDTFAEAWTACGAHTECGAITQWTDGKESLYYLRRAGDPESPEGGTSSILYSCQHQQMPTLVPNPVAAPVQTPAHSPPVQFPNQFPEHSILCFAVMQPSGNEAELIKMQLAHRAGIFGCDEYAVYSSEVFDIAGGVRTRKVNSDLNCVLGGEFLTAMNTPIFFAVWDALLRDGRFRQHKWTVKADPDTVFLPSRLRVALERHTPPAGGLYINNCKFGLHGPIEIMSQKAMDVLATGKQQCADAFNRLCSGDCFWGEDMFADQCFQTVFKGVGRADDWSILMEDHCEPPYEFLNGKSCAYSNIVAFHPFKAPEAWLGCLHGTEAAR